MTSLSRKELSKSYFDKKSGLGQGPVKQDTKVRSRNTSRSPNSHEKAPTIPSTTHGHLYLSALMS